MADKKKGDAPDNTTETFELLLTERDKEFYVLRLYVSGMTLKSQRAIKNIQDICEKHLQGRYQLEIIDVYQQPTLAKGSQIVAVPTLVRELPLPLRKFVGDLSRLERVLIGLDIKSKE